VTGVTSLDGAWELRYFPEGSLAVDGPDALSRSGAPAVPAQVPGNVELDLVRAGVLAEPFTGEGILAVQQYETYEWWYSRRFAAPAGVGGRRVTLAFRGLDCLATVWVNGTQVGTAANMFIEHAFDVTSVLAPDNRVTVRIRSAVLAARAMDYPAAAYALVTNHEQLRIRKAPHMYGWDIAPRVVSAGLWRGVELRVHDPAGIRHVYYHTRSTDTSGHASVESGPTLAAAGSAAGEKEALLGVHWQVQIPDRELAGYAIRWTGACGTSRFSHETAVRFTAGTCEIRVPAARLWWPKGYGEPALYTVRCELLKDGVVVDAREERIGIRSIALRRSEITSASEPGEFLVLCNGVPVMCKGTNWVPLDAFHARDAARYDMALALLREIGCNIVRCWGGNVYEDHRFFDACDESGIMVWQDFAFACGLYPQDADFHAEVRAEAIAVVRSLRNHPSIALWAGDNEIDIFAAMMDRDPAVNAISRRVLPEVCAAEDPGRVYLPSSPYVSPEAFRRGAADQRIMPEQHLWGPRDYFKSRYYAESTAHFASEMGYHGCPNVSSIRRFIEPGSLWPWAGNSQWRVHASDQVPGGGPYAGRIKLMADQVRELFGGDPATLEEFALASQVSQAEAKKFFVEMFRIARWRRTGVIWWNLLDCWPQFSDAVVDYYGGRKLAYWYLRRAQAPVLLMMGEPEDWRCRLVAGNDTLQEAAGEFRVSDAGTGATVIAGRYRVPPNANAEIGRIPVSRGEHRLFLLRWSAAGREWGSHYLLGTPPFSLAQYRAWLPSVAALPDGFDAASVGA
jgi:beta-mannosidase